MTILLVALLLLVPAPRASARDKSGVKWIALPGGAFDMGSEKWEDAKPVHRVTVKPFAVAKAPVTNRQYRACVKAGACTPPAVKCAEPPFNGDDQPVACVTWDQAAAYARWVGGRLPSEAEWEYAARGTGKTGAHPWGDAPATCALAVLDEGGYGCGRKSSWPVCSKPAGNTAQGLCDMLGEVYEWTADAYHVSYDSAPADGSAWTDPPADYRAVRGGSWSRQADYLDATLRSAAKPDNGNVTLGFRPVRDLR